MVKEFCLAWEKNKSQLEEYFRTHKQEEYDSYTKLVKLLFDITINPEINIDTIWSSNARYATDKILVIDDGEWQGSLIFILHQNYYHPSVKNYVYTSVDYGSCSGCDTLLGINSYLTDCLPTEKQIQDYMILCLHLLQNCVMMKEGEQE